MLIILPKKNDGLPAHLTRLLDSASLPMFKKLFSKAFYENKRFELQMPKFILSGESIDLKEPQKTLGINEVFTKRPTFLESVKNRASTLAV